MEKKIQTIAYLVIAMTVFNFLYGFGDRISRWNMWNWYLVILAGTIGVLLYIKMKQLQQIHTLATIEAENEKIRLALKKKDQLDVLYQMNDDEFTKLVADLYKLEGIENIEVLPLDEYGFHLLMWHQGTKIILRYYKQRPIVTYPTEERTILELEGAKVTIEQVREFFGIKNDYNVQADEAIIITTTSYTDEVFEFAKRNKLTLLDGSELVNKIQVLKSK